MSAVSGGTATLSLAPAATLVFVKTTSPVALDQTVTAFRSDGKPLPAANVWISKTRNADNSLALTYFKVNERQYIEIFPGLPAGKDDRLLHIAFETNDLEALRL